MATRKNTNDTIENTDINPNIKTDAGVAGSRYIGLLNVWGNPNAGPTNCGRQQVYADFYKAPKFPAVTNLFDIASPSYPNPVPAPTDGATIQASDRNSAADKINTLNQATINNLMPLAVNYPQIFSNTIPMVSANQIISAYDHVNILIDKLDLLFSLYNNYNFFWDGNNLCARSCQVACQTACQTSCQGCNTSQCHNQKCGAH